MKNRVIFGVAVLGLLSGCTSIQVDPLPYDQEFSHVCIENNPRVIVAGFVAVVESEFEKRGVSTEVYSDERPSNCAYWLTYTANQTWDLGTYMHHAELRLYRDSKKIGFAQYHLNGKGGLALNKWASVESKMGPVMDELLSKY